MAVLDDASFGIIRTNPKLSGNIQLVIDSNDNIYWETIPLNSTLNKNKYQALKTRDDNSLENDISRFFSDINNTNFYLNYRESSDLDVKNKYGSQYEMHYTAGARFENNINYTETISFFSPIWLREQLPSGFAIFRLPNAVDKDLESSITDGDIFKNNILEKAELVKYFDLSDNSQAGRYLLNYINNPDKPNNAFLFGNNKRSQFYGISLDENGFANFDENLREDYFLNQTPQIENDWLITKGWQRNRIIHPNIINIKFLFDDDKELYTFDRYFGFYVDALFETSFILDSNKQAKPPKKDTQTQLDNLNIVTINNKLQSNENGVILYADEETVESRYDGINNFDTLPDKQFFEDNSGLFWLKDKNNIYHTLKQDEKLQKGKLRLPYNQIDLKNYTGLNFLEFNPVGFRAERNGRPSVVFDIENLTKQTNFFITEKESNVYRLNLKNVPLDGYTFYIRFYSYLDNKWRNFSVIASDVDTEVVGNQIKDKFEKLYPDFSIRWKIDVISNGNNGHYIEFTEKIPEIKRLIFELDVNDETSTKVNETIEDTIIEYEDLGIDISDWTVYGDDTLDAGKNDDVYFSVNGSKEEQSLALASAINSVTNGKWYATPQDGLVVVTTSRLNEKDFIVGQNLQSIGLGVVEIFSGNLEEFGSDIGWRIWNFKKGGRKKQRIHIDREVGEIIEERLDETSLWVKVIENNQNFYRKVLEVTRYFDNPSDVGGITEVAEFINLNKYSTLIIDTNGLPVLDKDSIIELWSPKKLEFGRFSFYNWKDFDFSTFDQKWNRLKDINIENRYYDDQLISVEDLRNFYNDDTANPDQIRYEKFANPDLLDFRKNNDFKTLNFSDTQIIDNNEYDYYKENYTTEFALPNRVSPFICKWVYKGGNDARDNGYRLNANPAFGFGNLSPDKFHLQKSPQFMTHEWAYLQKLPPYFYQYWYQNGMDEQVNSYFSDKIDIDKLYKNNIDYFGRYFTVDRFIFHKYEPKSNFINYSNGLGFDGNIIKKNNNNEWTTIDPNDDLNTYLHGYCLNKVDDPIDVSVKRQFRWSRLIDGDQFKPTQGVFHGIKVEVYNRDENSELNFNSQNVNKIPTSFYNGYRFSAVMVPHAGEYPTGTPRRTTEIEFIENRAYKTITMVIYVNWDSNYNRVYDLIHKVVENQNNNTISEFLDLEEQPAHFLDKTMLYGLTSKWRNPYSFGDSNDVLRNFYDDIELQGSLLIANNTRSSFSNGEIYGGTGLSGQESRFLNDIRPLPGGQYSNIIVLAGPFNFQFTVEEVLRNDFLKAELSSFINRNTNTTQQQPAFLSENDAKTGPYLYENGGYLFWDKRGLDISFTSIAKWVNDGAPWVNYKTVDTDGVIRNNQFIIRLVTPEISMNNLTIEANIDENRPVNFQSDRVIGYDINYKDIKRTVPTLRHKGFYEPSFKSLFNFIDPVIIESESIEGQRSEFYQNKNINFQVNDIQEPQGEIKDFFYHKVNELGNKVIELNENTNLLPKYRLIGEIPIDKKDFSLWSSNWNDNYFVRHIERKSSTNVHGTFSMVEKPSFFGSKILHTPNNFTIHEWDYRNIDNENEITIPADSETDHRQVQLLQNENLVTLWVDIAKSYRDYLIDNQTLKNIFDKWVLIRNNDITNIEDKISQYVTNNILERYLIDNIRFYVIPNGSNNLITTDLVSNSNLVGDFRVQTPYVNYPLFIKLIYNKRSGGSNVDIALEATIQQK